MSLIEQLFENRFTPLVDGTIRHIYYKHSLSHNDSEYEEENGPISLYYIRTSNGNDPFWHAYCYIDNKKQAVIMEMHISFLSYTDIQIIGYCILTCVDNDSDNHIPTCRNNGKETIKAFRKKMKNSAIDYENNWDITFNSLLCSRVKSAR